MALKLYKIKTVLKYLVKSWRNSAYIVKQNPQMCRLSAYFSLLYWFYFYGNDFNDYCTFRFWEKSRKEKKSYVSLRRNDRLRFALSTPEVHKLFLDKAKFNIRFSKFIKRRWILVSSTSQLEIERFVMVEKSVVAKPLSDFGGHGIIKINSNENHTNDYITSLLGKQYIIEECIQNIEQLRKLAPGSLNTIRIVTLIDRFGHLHILAALLRMGNGIGYTDNYHDGGIACPIDISNGSLKGNAYGMGCIEYEKHPLSKIKFDGFRVPDFDKCIDLVKEIAFEEPAARYVGWDFAITPNGIELIEGNIPPGEDITQIAAGRGLWNEINELL